MLRRGLLPLLMLAALGGGAAPMPEARSAPPPAPPPPTPKPAATKPDDDLPEDAAAPVAKARPSYQRRTHRRPGQTEADAIAALAKAQERRDKKAAKYRARQKRKDAGE